MSFSSAPSASHPGFEPSAEWKPVYVRCDLPEGRSGAWILERFEVRAPEVGAGADPRPAWARSPAGFYARLRHGGVVVMTDTHEEWWTQCEGIREACRRGGEVLVSGLGLGVAVESMLQTAGSRVTRVTVLESSRGVIELVGPHLKRRYGGRVRILRADAFDWPVPEGVRFSVVWHDIWPNPYDPDVPAQMDHLEQRFSAHCDWQGCWGRELSPSVAADATQEGKSN